MLDILATTLADHELDTVKTDDGRLVSAALAFDDSGLPRDL
jgi:hypothetical protein